MGKEDDRGTPDVPVAEKKERADAYRTGMAVY